MMFSIYQKQSSFQAEFGFASSYKTLQKSYSPSDSYIQLFLRSTTLRVSLTQSNHTFDVWKKGFNCFISFFLLYFRQEVLQTLKFSQRTVWSNLHIRYLLALSRNWNDKFEPALDTYTLLKNRKLPYWLHIHMYKNYVSVHFYFLFTFALLCSVCTCMKTEFNE